MGQQEGGRLGGADQQRDCCLDKFIAATPEWLSSEGGVVRAVRRGGL